MIISNAGPTARVGATGQYPTKPVRHDDTPHSGFGALAERLAGVVDDLVQRDLGGLAGLAVGQFHLAVR